MSPRVRLLGGFGVLLALVTAVGTAAPRRGARLSPLAVVLADTDRKEFYHLAEGSELFPAEWLAALVSTRSGKPLLDDLERFGAIADPAGPEVKSATGTYRLPVGLTLAASRADGMKMVGVNCAACHVGELQYKDKTVRIDGGPSLFDLEGFYQEVFDSFAATVKDRKALLAFLDRLARSPDRTPSAALAAKLHTALGIEGAKGGLAEAVVGRLNDLAREGADPGLALDYYRLLAPTGAARLDTTSIDLLENLSKRIEARALVPLGLKGLLQPKREAAEMEVMAGLKVLSPTGLAQLEARVVFLRRLSRQHASGTPQYPGGHGRVDAFVTARNLLFPERDALPATSPVRFPAIWNLSERKWLHWDANTNSILERNIGQALGLGAVATPDGHSTVLPKNLHTLEGYARQLTPPTWPAAFGPIVAARREAGKRLYDTYCAGCHDKGTGEYEGDDKEFAGFRVYSLKDLGTDPERAENFAKPLSDRTPFALALGAKLRALKKQSYADHAIPVADQQKYDRPDATIRWVTTRGYVARPLAGVWATAPYLHNGSVPTLDDLLRPEEERPVVFPVGPTEYDPVKVGVVSTFAAVPRSQYRRMGIYDSRLKGNSNRGHSGEKFGTQLPGEDRAALLEYLKSLGG